MRSVLRALVTVTAALACALAPPAAHADEVTAELDLRTKAQLELKALVAALDAADQRRLVGIYAAFHADPGDPFAMAACDDDGDYVVVVSDAMLRLAANVARAQTYDDASPSRKIEEYASFVARSQVPGRRLLPPPPGFFAAERAAPTYDERLRETLAFVLARGLTHLRAGELVCRRPTATKEAGDDEWTTTEQRRALDASTAMYPGRPARDEEAIARVLDAGRGATGALGLLRFFGQLEAERRVFVSRFAPTYLAHYPQSGGRAAAVRAAVEAHRGGERSL